ncbi:MAG: tRNA (adenosine(37)-N6)-threonylcarbamoyltransferase complex ATPase subunit type 1 TsaE [Candidatus Krumholzibacteria bacterium]|nr:tRNA (adenosine(37)-N6)-threonylcarbamoyltransferase complex ATPase subunit type 1 TsaE [Candidatus Krumholzibacteria bacterium]
MTDGRKTQRYRVQSLSESGTLEIGARFGCRIDRPLCICLVGSLGVGKSVIARGICEGLGVDEMVVSPSFILCEEYDARIPVIHVDLYRLEHESEVDELGLYDRMNDAVVLVEWGDRSANLLDAADIVIRLSVSGQKERAIELTCPETLGSICEGLQP